MLYLYRSQYLYIDNFKNLIEILGKAFLRTDIFEKGQRDPQTLVLELFCSYFSRI